MERKFEESAAEHERDLLQLRNQTASLSMGQRLQVAQQNSAERLVGLEKLVALKLDKSDIGHIEAMAENLQRFESFRVGTLEAVGRLEDKTAEHERRLDADEGILGDHFSRLEKLRSDVDSSAKRTELCSVAKEMENLKKELGASYVHRSEGDENLGRLRSLETRADESDRFAARTTSAMDKTDRVLQTKASVEDMHACVLRKHFEEVVRTLGEDLDTRATMLHVGDVEARTRALESNMGEAQGRLDVAIRFVDWFTQRGEQYEHNIRIIDKHISNLANSQRPFDRNPFQGEMRFTEVMGEGLPSFKSTSGGGSSRGSVGVRLQPGVAGLGVHSGDRLSASAVPSSDGSNASGNNAGRVEDVSELLGEMASLVRGTGKK